MNTNATCRATQGVPGISYKEVFFVIALLMLPIFFLGVRVMDEPFSLFDGTSMWPAEFLKMVAMWLSFFLLFRGWNHMKSSSKVIEQELRLMPAVCKDRTNIADIWYRYKQGGAASQRWHRTWKVALGWGVMCVLLYYIQEPNIPFRGDGVYVIDQVLTYSAFTGFVVLFAFVSDATMYCRRFIQCLIDPGTTSCSWPANDGSDALIQDMKRKWYEIQLIGMRSDDISRTIYYPFYVILLLLASYTDYFDNFDIPVSLMLIGSINVVLILMFSILLRRKAIEAKSAALKKMAAIEEKILRAGAKHRKSRMRQLHLYNRFILEYSEGAFLPITEQPWLRALTLITGGGSSLLLLQYLAG